MIFAKVKYCFVILSRKYIPALKSFMAISDKNVGKQKNRLFCVFTVQELTSQ